MRFRWGAAAVLLAACSNAPQSPPLAALPECSEAPPAVAEAPEGFIGPEGAVIQQITPQDPVTQVVAYVAKTPGQIRLEYDQRSDIDVLSSEDEVFEAEILVSDGNFRTYVRATAACKRGSHLLAIVAPEAAAGAVPTPAGTPASTPVPVPVPTP
jgi:hypothetical protein